MKVAGIIVEYNPLHNGHVYHINQTRQLSKCNCLVAVMSSSFTQRGEPAIIDKFARTRFALQNGVDLVIELPFVFGVQNADIFAKTSVAILHHIGVTDIYFGSESGSVEELEVMGDLLQSEEYRDTLNTFLKQGDSFPTASDKAIQMISPNSVYNQPNNILGIQYILAGKELASPIAFHTIKRVQSGYYDDVLTDHPIQSATAIRKRRLHDEEFKDFVPRDVYHELLQRHPVTYNDFTGAFQTIISRIPTTELSTIYHVSEGLENRIKQVSSFQSVDELIEKIISRRYTNSRLQRLLAHLLCNVHKEDIPTFEIPYVRILGMSSSGRDYLRSIKHTCEIPIYTKIKEGLHPYIDIELRVSKIYSLASDKDIFKEEFKPVIF